MSRMRYTRKMRVGKQYPQYNEKHRSDGETAGIIVTIAMLGVFLVAIGIGVGSCTTSRSNANQVQEDRVMQRVLQRMDAEQE